MIFFIHLNRFFSLTGAGYHLVIVKSPSCKVSNITEFITTSIPSSKFESEVNAELTYLLPDDQAEHFPKLLRELEAKKEELGIVNFGATATTMEEVFLKCVIFYFTVKSVSIGHPGEQKLVAV
jgi:ATP-binding cassette subfamily A (ABC1) protein 3